jgi:4a-hydroxytetrahydrobiopterin dehydratase
MASSSLLSDDAVEVWLSSHTTWARRDGTTIRRSVECSSFPAAIELVTEVAAAAEAANHHPDMDIRWRTVVLALSTHSEGGLTDKDLRLAERIDELAPAS